MKILIIGSEGSIGKRHKANLDILGYKDVDCYDLNLEGSKPDEVASFDLVIIATPPETHLEYLHQLSNAGVKYIMCEKPLFVYPTIFQVMQEGGAKPHASESVSQIFVNNAYRFARSLNKLKECLPMVGEVWQASLENQYSFEKLHAHYTPEQRQSYHIIYDDSHIINTSRYLFGEPKEIIGKAITPDYSQWLWKTEGGVLVAHKTHILDQRYKKRIEVSGSEGTLTWNWRSHEIFFSPKDESERIAIAVKHCCHLTEALKFVLDVVENKGEFTENTIFDAIKDMEIIKELMS